MRLLLVFGLLPGLLLCAAAAPAEEIAVDLTANYAEDLYIPEGSPVFVTWSTTGDPSGCRATGGWSGLKDPAGGEERTQPLTESEVFGIDCRKDGVVVSDSVEVHVSERWSSSSTDLVGSFDCDPDDEGDCVRHELRVACNGLPERSVHIWEYPPHALPPVGGVVLSIGGDGVGRYGADDDVRAETIEVLRDGGFEVFVVGWALVPGWKEYGAGLANPLCSYAQAARWIHASIADVSTTFCAQGNSGGATMIAYGLEIYGLDDIFDMVVLTAGPNYSRIDDFCFNPDYSGYGGSGKGDSVDWFHAWDPWEFCQASDGEGWHEYVTDLDSLVSDHQSRTLHYPGTKVNIICSEGDHTLNRAIVFHEALTSPTEFHVIEGDAHGADRTPEGSQLVRDLMLTECVDGGPS